MAGRQHRRDLEVGAGGEPVEMGDSLHARRSVIVVQVSEVAPEVAGVTLLVGETVAMLDHRP